MYGVSVAVMGPPQGRSRDRLILTHRRPTRHRFLPDPKPEEGYAYRWIRIATQGKEDPTNISGKRREGWEPVKASDHPEIRLFGSASGNFPDSIQIGGLMLCKTPVEFTEQRNAYYRQQADAQMQSVDNTYMRENDPRMPMFKERKSTVTFGKGT